MDSSYHYFRKDVKKPFGKIISFFSTPTQSRTLGILAIVAIIAAIPLTIFIAQRQQEIRQRASAATCQDNPSTPPSGYIWKADCQGTKNLNNQASCFVNQPICTVDPNTLTTTEKQQRQQICNVNCPPNTSDPNHVDPTTSNWCYGFSGPLGTPTDTTPNWRCLQLQYIGGSFGGCAPSTDPNSACTNCIITNRNDILPYYEKNGWDISCSNQNNVIANWCGIDSTGCNTIKTGACSSVCKGGITQTPTPPPAQTNFSCNPTSPSFNAHPPAGTLTMSATSVGVGGTVSFTLSGEAPLTVPEIPSISIQKMELYYRQESPTKGTWTKIGITGNDNCLVGNCPVNPAVTNPWTVTWNPPSAGTYTIAANIYTNMGRISGTPDLGTPNFIPSIDANHCCSKTIEYPPGTPNQPYCWTGPDSGLAKTLTVTSQTVTNPPVTNPPTTPACTVSGGYCSLDSQCCSKKCNTTADKRTGTCAPIPTNSPTPIPTGGPTVTVTTVPLNAINLAFDLILDGVGFDCNVSKGGCTKIALNNNPQHKTRNAVAEIFDQQNKSMGTQSGTLTFNEQDGHFNGIIAFNSNIQSGTYTVKIKTNPYLKKLIPGIQNLVIGQTNQMTTVSPAAGDVNGDNKLDILDYNILISCFTNQSCQQKDLGADIDDNGIVDLNDINLFIRNLSIQNGD